MKQSAVLGGGCFWCLEAVYLQVSGVESVESGYAGGWKENPTYEEVCTGTTGHAEVVRIFFDSSQTSYSNLLNVFWKCHDPTTLNRQGADTGTQYRSLLLYQDEAQKLVAEESLRKSQADWSAPIVTKIEPLGKFWAAETYHQNYYKLHPFQGYCRAVISPKLKKMGFSFL